MQREATPPRQRPDCLSISRETVRQIALGVDRYQLMRARFGTQAANLKVRPRSAGVFTSRPLERVELDHFLVDSHVVCGRTGVRLGRPWLTAAVDHYSGMIVGYHLSFAPPSAASVLAAVRHAILPKEISGGAWLSYGIPDSVVVDNGLDLLSDAVKDAFVALGIDLVYTPPRTPWFKGTIERFGRTLNTRLVHWLPGTTLGKPTSALGYVAKEHAVLTFESFEALLEQYIVTVHNMTPRRAKQLSPHQRWLRGVREWPVRLPASQDEFDAAVALTFSVKLQQTGVHFLDLHYQNEELGELYKRTPPGTRVTLKVNPLDLKSIKVIKPVTQQVMTIACVSHVEWPRSLSYHKAVRQFARDDGRDPAVARDLMMAELALKTSIERAADKGKRDLRRMQAEFLRQAQRPDGIEPAPTADEPATDVIDELQELLDGAFDDE